MNDEATTPEYTDDEPLYPQAPDEIMYQCVVEDRGYKFLSDEEWKDWWTFRNGEVIDLEINDIPHYGSREVLTQSHNLDDIVRFQRQYARQYAAEHWYPYSDTIVFIERCTYSRASGHRRLIDREPYYPPEEKPNYYEEARRMVRDTLYPDGYSKERAEEVVYIPKNSTLNQLIERRNAQRGSHES